RCAVAQRILRDVALACRGGCTNDGRHPDPHLEREMMTFTRWFLGGALAGALALSCLLPRAAHAGNEPAPAAAAGSDGSHDFDFNLGVWKSRIRRYTHPLTGQTDFIELSGTVSVRGVWGGRALLEEIEADGPKGHWEGLTLFLYNPKAGQWTQSFA